MGYVLVAPVGTLLGLYALWVLVNKDDEVTLRATNNAKFGQIEGKRWQATALQNIDRARRIGDEHEHDFAGEFKQADSGVKVALTPDRA